MLAIDGGPPVRTTAWPAWPCFEQDEVEAAAAVLASGRVNYWTGTVGRTFETAFAEMVDVHHGVAVSNGTVALEVALRGLGIGPGDEVIVPSCTFVATATAVLSLGAVPVFAELCPRSCNVTPETVDAVATPRTRAVIVVHVGGWPARVVEFATLCETRGWAFIEDCAQAHGARVEGRSVGSFSDAAAFSFCQDKIMTTGGEGGMVVAHETDLARRIWSAKDHGKSWEAVYEREHPPGFRWLHESLGSNGRMTEMQAAIGLRQLAKLPGWVAARRAYAQRLGAALRQYDAFDVPEPPAGVESAYYRLYAQVRPEALAEGWSRDRLMVALEAEGLPCRVGSCTEIYKERVFDGLRCPEHPIAAKLGRTNVAFTTHPTITADALDDAERAIDKVMTVASR